MARVLFTTFEGGGHVPPSLLVAHELMARGHDVLVVSDPYNASAAAEKRLPFTPWRRAPRRVAAAQVDDPMDDWKSRWPPAVVRRLCDGVITGPALAYATDVMEIAREFAPDVIVSQELLFGSIMAAEKMSIPVALLTANLWCYPTRTDVPPFGPGFGLAASRGDQGRDRVVRGMVRSFFDVGLPALNHARQAIGLPEVRHTLDQLAAVERVILGVSMAFDFARQDKPAGFVYAGPLYETPSWAGDDVPFPENGRPNVLISFSTTFQNQRAVLVRCMKAAASLPINAIVTLGPAVSREGLPVSDNLKVVLQGSHYLIVPKCQAVLCHGGHGTVLRPLRHGVPVVAIPMGRDHADNAARLEWKKAGRRLSERASVRRIARTLWQVVTEPSYKKGAGRLQLELEGPQESIDRAAAGVLELVPARTAGALKVRSPSIVTTPFAEAAAQ